LFDPVVSEDWAAYPDAVLYDPVVSEDWAYTPAAVLFDPVVIAYLSLINL